MISLRKSPEVMKEEFFMLRYRATFDDNIPP
jgi:hypothetical protein